MHEIKENFEYSFLDPFEISNNNAVVMVSSILIKSPTHRQKDLVFKVAQAINTANFELVQKMASLGTSRSDLVEAEKSAEDNDDSELAKYKQITMSLFSSSVDMTNLQNIFKTLIISEGTFLMPESVTLSTNRYSKISIRDLVNMLSGYVCNFIMPILT